MLIQIKLLLLTALVGVSLGLDWNSYKTTYSVRFSSPREENMRKNIYAKNLNAINLHNKKAKMDKSITYLKAPNEFTHLRYDEFIARYTGYNRTRKTINEHNISYGNGQSHQNGNRAQKTTKKPSGCSCACTTPHSFESTNKSHSVTPIHSAAHSVDWRNTPLVGPIKNQGACG